MQFEVGQRVALVRTTDPHTHLRPGDHGTVRRVDPAQHRVDVTWDNGSTLSMLLDAGDDLTALTALPAADPATATGTGTDMAIAVPDLLDALRIVGGTDGVDAAEWWTQNTLGGRAGGDTTVRARRILAGIEDGDPAILDTLPSADADWTASHHIGHRGTNAAGHVEAAAGLTGEQRQQAEAAYLEGFSAAVIDAVAAACRRTLHPTGDGRDLSALHPDRVTFGSVGVFSGDWNDTGADPDSGFPLTAGYVGTLIDRWNGWAVFACTRTVAEAIVTDQQRTRDAYRADLAAAGVPQGDLDRQTDQVYSRLWWDGDVIVADSTVLHDDPEAVERIEPRPDGRYVVMGRSWCWEAVDPYDCARIVGELPEPGHEREWVLLTHSPYTIVPPDPYTIGSLASADSAVGGYTAELRYAGEPVAAAVGVAAPGRTPVSARLTATTGRFDPAGWAAYVAAARRCGEPMTEAAVLDALAEDALLAAATSEATAASDTLARLLDNTGTVLALRRLTPAPSSPQMVTAACDRLRAAGPSPVGGVWQFWNGHVWRHLMPATPTIPATPSDTTTTAG
ncbi:DUF4314 domain-containing protein [Dactylosporangium sp. NPDC050688]|uniref:DUF4314 domain-containing protein n=1 Tax=Dactylosporangium sp. NPDC050688 TaxID=3157217 RepID=UPI0033ECDF1A